METRQRARAGRAIRHGDQDLLSLSLRTILCLALIGGFLALPATSALAGKKNPAPPPPPPPQISTGPGTVTASFGVGGASGGGAAQQSGGGGGGSAPGSPASSGDGGGGGPGYFTIVLPGDSPRPDSSNTFDASYVQSCADQGSSTVSYQWSGGGNSPSGNDTSSGGGGGGGGGGAGGHSALPWRRAMYAALQGKYASTGQTISLSTPQPPPPAFPTAQKAPWLGPTPVPNLVGGGGGPGDNAVPPAYGPVAGGPAASGDPVPPGPNMLLQPVNYPWWMLQSQNGSGGTGASAPSAVAQADSCAGGNSSMLMRNALLVSGGGGGRRMGGKLVLSCTANLSGAVSAAVLTGVASFGYNVSGLIPFTSCFPVSPTDDAPCPPSLGAGLTMNCPGDVRSGWSFGGASVIVSISIPPVRVVRTPFPRGIVTVANVMVVDGAPTTNGPNWSNLIKFP